MTEQTNPLKPQSAFCEVCLKLVPSSEALIAKACKQHSLRDALRAGSEEPNEP